MWLLLDTNILLWTVFSSDRLSSAARASIEDPANRVAFSAASIWEVAIKFGLGRPDFVIRPDTVLAEARLMGFEELTIGAEDALAVLELPRHHGDPFDRMLIAQALRGPRHLLTSDRALLRYSELVKLVG